MKHDRWCKKCGHLMLLHANLPHNSDCRAYRRRHTHEEKRIVHERTNIRNKKGKVSYCHACRRANKACLTRGDHL